MARNTLILVLLLLTLGYGTLPSALLRAEQTTSFPEPIIPTLQHEVEDLIERYLAEPLADTRTSLASGVALPARFKTPVAVRTLTGPWAGLSALERSGIQAAALAQATPSRLTELIASLEEGRGLTADIPSSVPVPDEATAEGQIADMTAILEQAARLRERALRKLSREDRHFLFDHAASLVEQFSPQASGLDERARGPAQETQRFVRLVGEQLDYAELVAAAQVLTQLADAARLERIRESFSAHGTVQTTIPGLAGDILMVRETQAGLIVIGGTGPNSYRLDRSIALLIDLGGDDHYAGVIAAPASVEQGINVVIDLSGQDRYQPTVLGLATGRLGVGLLVDRGGDDAYDLAPGSGGAGFAGLGLLEDTAGQDTYLGNRFTQGAAIGGLGLLLDRAGQDRYDSFGYALGFGGPLGIGAVIDASGDDAYRCGGQIPSRYNEDDHPDAKPGDPTFQYDCFGMGTGSGRRIFPQAPAESSLEDLAGGLGFLIDIAGNDRYDSANFSQGAGYFFGTGMKLDLSGNDEHDAARYGQAAGAHYGIGFFADYQGDDRYGSTGPVYNGGAAWDRSVALFVDAGERADRYEWSRSSGLGLADHHAWGLFIDQGGTDRYRIAEGLGRAFDKSLGGFFDLDGDDDYALLPPSDGGREQNHRTLADPTGGLFHDR